MTASTDIKGFTLYANYGAGFPIFEGTITSIENGFASFSDGEETHTVKLSSIKTSPYRSPNGSSIGVYLNEADAYA